MATLTARQREIYEHLLARHRAGEPPAGLNELCVELGLASRGSLHKQIAALVEAGLVEPMGRRPTGVVLTRDATDDGRLPLLGEIAAGRPLAPVVDPERLEVPADLRPTPGCYLLRVRGESMRDAGILDGDLAVVEPREAVRDGDTVVALIDDTEVTLKVLERRGGRILLHAANPAFATQVYEPERVRVQGVLCGLLRRYR